MKKINSFDDVVSLVLNTPSNCKFAKSLKNAKTRQQIEKIEVGQVWRVKLDNEGNAFSAVLTKLPVKMLNTAEEYIEMVPLYVSPFDEDIDRETDICVDAADMPNGLPSIPEWWNKISVFVTDLDKCYGKLESNILSNLLDRLTNQPKSINLSKSGKMFRERETNKYSAFSIREKTVLPQKPNAIRPWQLWRFSYDNGEKYAFGVVNSVISNMNDDTEYIQIIPAYLNYSENETTEKDVKLLSSDTSLYLPILVEAWNNAVIDSKQLDTFYGNVGINYRSLISNYFGEKAENLPEEVNSFRQYERNLSNSYSIEVYNKISNSVIIPENYDTFYQIASNELMTLAAATDDYNKKLEDFYYNIIIPAVDTNNEFYAELMSDYVSIMSENSVDYSLTLEDEYDAKIVFNSKNGMVKISAKDLEGFNCKLVGIKIQK